MAYFWIDGNIISSAFDSFNTINLTEYDEIELFKFVGYKGCILKRCIINLLSKCQSIGLRNVLFLLLDECNNNCDCIFFSFETVYRMPHKFDEIKYTDPRTNQRYEFPKTEVSPFIFYVDKKILKSKLVTMLLNDESESECINYVTKSVDCLIDLPCDFKHHEQYKGYNDYCTSLDISILKSYTRLALKLIAKYASKICFSWNSDIVTNAMRFAIKCKNEEITMAIISMLEQCDEQNSIRKSIFGKSGNVNFVMYAIENGLPKTACQIIKNDGYNNCMPYQTLLKACEYGSDTVANLLLAKYGNTKCLLLKYGHSTPIAIAYKTGFKMPMFWTNIYDLYKNGYDFSRGDIEIIEKKLKSRHIKKNSNPSTQSHSLAFNSSSDSSGSSNSSSLSCSIGTSGSLKLSRDLSQIKNYVSYNGVVLTDLDSAIDYYTSNIRGNKTEAEQYKKVFKYFL